MAKKELTKLHRALRFAVKRHRGQDRDGDTPIPYVTHPVEVLIRLRGEAGVDDEDELCAALLHDLIEETETTAEDLEERFGPRVAGLVRELTRREPDEQEREGLDEEGVWALRTTIMLSEIAQMSQEAKRIKLADRLCNVQDALRTRSGPPLDRYVKQTFMILEAIQREVSPALWDAIQALLPKPKRERTIRPEVES